MPQMTSQRFKLVHGECCLHASKKSKQSWMKRGGAISMDGGMRSAEISAFGLHTLHDMAVWRELLPGPSTIHGTRARRNSTRRCSCMCTSIRHVLASLVKADRNSPSHWRCFLQQTLSWHHPGMRWICAAGSVILSDGFLGLCAVWCETLRGR